MTLAQKKARDNFKKAIAYRKKTGCSLKQAFAYVKGGKVTGVKKAVVKKKAVKKAAKKKAVSSHKDTKSHNVNIRVVSGINQKTLNEIERVKKEIQTHERYLYNVTKALSSVSIEKFEKKFILQEQKTLKNVLIHFKKYLKSLQLTLKKNI